jgi:hypothetical protein
LAHPLNGRRGRINPQTLECFDEPSKVIIASTVREIGDWTCSGITSLVDLSFGEGLVRIGANSFQSCEKLQILTFPASLEVIGEYAFSVCDSLRNLMFRVGSQLPCINNGAFTYISLETVILPATVKAIDPSAFSPEVWPLVAFDGPPPLVMNGAQ